jgi:nucleotide-binding universal stress UspA family protein
MSGLQPKTTVVPIDFSELSLAALDRALEITHPEGQVHAIHVLAALNVMEPGLIYGTESDATRIENTLKHMDEKLAGDKYARVSKHAIVGDPGQEIADFAKENQAELIVIPSHGYGFLRHILLGSVAERVVRLAHCPVLVLRS